VFSLIDDFPFALLPPALLALAWGRSQLLGLGPE
jgi:hypothetical protein